MTTNEFEFNESFGSCQYDSAANMFAMLMTMDVKEVMAKFNIIAKPRDVNDFIFTRFIYSLLDDIDDDDLEYLTTQYDSINDNYPRKPSYAVTSMFHTCRDAAWDLWSAAPFIANICFTELDISNIPENENVKGPILNRLCQGENNNVAVYCYLLTKFGFVDDTEPFNDFST